MGRCCGLRLRGPLRRGPNRHRGEGVHCLSAFPRPLPSFPRKRESMGLILRCASISILSSLLFHSPAGSEGILFRVSRDVSPLAGRVTFFCIRQKKVTKEKASPKVTVAARLPCDARDLGPVHKLAPYGRSNIWTGNLPRPLRFSASPTGPKVKGKGKVKIKTNRRNAAVWPLTCLPFGAAEERRRSGGLLSPYV